MNVLRMAIMVTTVIAAISPPERAATASTVISVPCGKPLSAVSPAAGSTIALKRGCTYTGPLTISTASVTVTAYSSGKIPVITLRQDGAAVDVSGSGTTIANVSLAGVAPRTWTCGGRRTPAGHVDGIDLEHGATDNTITDISASGFYAGVYVAAGSSGNIDREFDLYQQHRA